MKCGDKAKRFRKARHARKNAGKCGLSPETWPVASFCQFSQSFRERFSRVHGIRNKTMPASTSSHEDFAELYAGCHLDLLRYVLTLLPDRHLAEDVVQETARVLWRKFADYDRARPFWPWARGIAHFEVRKARSRLAMRKRWF